MRAEETVSSSTTSSAATEVNAKAKDARSRTLRYVDAGPLGRRRNLHGGDQRTGRQHRVEVGPVVGQPVKVVERQTMRTRTVLEQDVGVQRRHGDGHVGRVHRHAVFGGAEYRVVADIAADGRASRAGRAFVARGRDVLEVDTSGALQEVSRRRREVAQLTRRGRQQGAREHRVAAADDGVGGEVTVADVCADPQAAARQLLDVGERQVTDVDDERGLDDAELHVVDEVGATGKEDGVGAVGDSGDRVGDAGGAVVIEGDHRAASCGREEQIESCGSEEQLDSLMAATMFG